MELVAVKGLGLGLSTGVYCLGSCVPVALPYLVANAESVRASGRAVVELAAGRLLAYLVLGAAAGVFGAQMQGSTVGHVAVAVSMIGLAALMIGYGLTRNFPESGACSRMAKSSVLRRYPFVAGLLMGVNLCPPILLCMAEIVRLRSVPGGLVMAVSFFAGSLVFLAPLAFAGLLGRMEWLKDVASVATLFCGLWFLVGGISVLVGG
jgi:sulfite exporter TauE/SafE